MKTVSFVCEHLGKGGAERVMSILIRNFISEGYKVQLVLLYEDLIEYPIPSNVEKVFLGFSRKRTLSEIVSRRNKLRRAINGDVIIAFLYGAIRDTAFSMLGSNKRLIISDRSDPAREPAGRFRRIIRTLSYCFTDAIVFQTTDAKNYFPSFIQKKGCIIPNPVSNSLPAANIDDAEKIVIAAGRFDPQKNFPLLIRSFARLNRDYPDYKLHIYGKGYLENELKKLVLDLGLSESVEFPGFVSDIASRMSKASLYVSSSDYEGISNSMLEAMAIGIPTICTDCPVGGAREMIKNGENGLLVSVGDEEELYLAMKKVLSDKDIARKLSENSKKIKEQLSEKVIFERWLKTVKG